MSDLKTLMSAALNGDARNPSPSEARITHEALHAVLVDQARQHRQQARRFWQAARALQLADQQGKTR